MAKKGWVSQRGKGSKSIVKSGCSVSEMFLGHISKIMKLMSQRY
jgi:hypothetical protein